MEKNYKTLFESEKIYNLLTKIGMQDYQIKNGNVKIIGSPLAKIFGEICLRMPVLGVGLLSIMQFDGIIKAKSNKERLIEFVKGAINVLCLTVCVALFGCLGRYHNRLGDLLGMGLGYIVGNKLSKAISEQLFEKR